MRAAPVERTASGAGRSRSNRCQESSRSSGLRENPTLGKLPSLTVPHGGSDVEDEWQEDNDHSSQVHKMPRTSVSALAPVRDRSAKSLKMSPEEGVKEEEEEEEEGANLIKSTEPLHSKARALSFDFGIFPEEDNDEHDHPALRQATRQGLCRITTSTPNPRIG